MKFKYNHKEENLLKAITVDWTKEEIEALQEDTKKMASLLKDEENKTNFISSLFSTKREHIILGLIKMGQVLQDYTQAKRKNSISLSTLEKLIRKHSKKEKVVLFDGKEEEEPLLN